MKIRKTSLSRAITATIVFAIVSAVLETMQGGIVIDEFIGALIVFFILFYIAFELIRRKKEKNKSAPKNKTEEDIHSPA